MGITKLFKRKSNKKSINIMDLSSYELPTFHNHLMATSHNSLVIHKKCKKPLEKCYCRSKYVDMDDDESMYVACNICYKHFGKCKHTKR